MTKLIFRTLGLYGSNLKDSTTEKEEKNPQWKGRLCIIIHDVSSSSLVGSGKSFLQNKCWKVATST